jgi:predicted dehydrogenase
LKVLIIGLGSIAQKHIQAIQAIQPNTEFFALRKSIDSKEIDGVTSLYGWGEITFTPDFIIISNPTSEHASTIEQSITYKCPIFIEKPSVNTLYQTESLLKLIKEHHIITYVGCVLRFHPVLLFVKSFLEKNKPTIQEINIYCGSYLPEWRKNTDYRKIYSAIPELGGGVHLDLIHELDYCYWIFGIPISNKKYFSSKSKLDIASFDYANYILDYADFNVSIILNYYRRDAKRTMEIVTDEDTITIDLLAGTVKKHSNDILFQTTTNIAEMYKNQMQHFIDCIASKKNSLNTFEESIEVLKICIP